METKMTDKNIIEPIIEKYLNNDLPDEVQAEFQAWMLSAQDWEEKENILEECFESLDPEFDYKHYKNKLLKLHDKIDLQKKVRSKEKWMKFVFLTSAASVLFAVMIGGFVLVKNSWFSAPTTVYVTSKENKGEFTLPDGSKVFLNSATRLEVPGNFNGKTRKVKLDGEAYFDVVKDSLRPFRVTTHLASIRVLGTAFDMKAYSDRDYAEVVLVRGSVEVSGGNLVEPIVMTPNQKVTIHKTALVEQVNSGNYISWTGRPLVIDNLALGDVLTNIEHWYNVQLIPVGPVDLNPHLTFNVTDESLESILRQISLVTRFHYKIKNDKLYYSTNGATDLNSNQK
jgi:transmembrane sensor